MQVGQDKYGMQTLNQALYNLLSRRMISHEEALNRSLEVDELKMMIEQQRPPSGGQAIRR